MEHSLAGVGRADITPQSPMRLEGYGRAAASTGVLDPLSATALALARDPAEPLVLISCDAAALLVADCDALRGAVAGALGIAAGRVHILYTHTHSAPAITPEYLDLLRERLVAAAGEAVGALRPARVGWGVAEADAALHRRPRDAQGRAYHGPNPAFPIDRRVGLLRVDGADGNPLAALLWYGAHGNVLKGESSVVSADWPGAARRVVEGALGCPGLVAIGASGNVNARWRGDAEALERMGLAVGGAALSAWAAVETAPIEALDVQSETLTLRMLPLPDEEEAERLAAEVLAHWERSVDAWAEAVRALRGAGHHTPRPLPLPVTVVRVNDGYLGGIPMEAFTEIGLSVAARFPERRVFFGGYVDGWIGYLPVADEYAAGGYEVNWAPAVYGPASGWLRPAVPETAGEVVEAAARLIGRLAAAGGGAS
jgi:hypothetical protein